MVLSQHMNVKCICRLNLFSNVLCGSLIPSSSKLMLIYECYIVSRGTSDQTAIAKACLLAVFKNLISNEVWWEASQFIEMFLINAQAMMLPVA